jgi:hypothetical protein
LSGRERSAAERIARAAETVQRNPLAAVGLVYMAWATAITAHPSFALLTLAMAVELARQHTLLERSKTHHPANRWEA